MDEKLTIPEQIMQAVADLVRQQGLTVFTRETIRQQIGVDRERWVASYDPTFQGMRIDQPGGAPKVAKKFRDVFQRVQRGKHRLTEYGKQLLAEYQAGHVPERLNK